MSQASNAQRGSAFVGDLMPPAATKTSATAEARTKKGRSYKLLPKEFQRHGFRYRQVAREGDVAIYEQTWNGCPNPSIAYEVVRVRCRNGFRIGGRWVEPAEVYPKSEAWGTDAWTVLDKESAFRKLRDIAQCSNCLAPLGQDRAEKSPT